MRLQSTAIQAYLCEIEKGVLVRRAEKGKAEKLQALRRSLAEFLLDYDEYLDVDFVEHIGAVWAERRGCQTPAILIDGIWLTTTTATYLPSGSPALQMVRPAGMTWQTVGAPVTTMADLGRELHASRSERIAA